MMKTGFFGPALAGATLLGALAGCGEGGNEITKTATAVITPTTAGAMGPSGTATFKDNGDKVRLTLSLTGLTPGMHGVHIHQMPNCGPDMAMTPGGAAGGHWNPANMSHGQIGKAAFHLGDIGNIVADADGKGSLTFETDLWEIGSGVPENDILDHALMIHAMADDFVTANTGNAGARIACGVIKQ